MFDNLLQCCIINSYCCLLACSLHGLESFPNIMVATYQLSWLSTWGASWLIHASLCWSCQSQTKSTPFHPEGCFPEIHLDKNLLREWRLSCTEYHLDTTCKVFPSMHPFWEQQHNLPKFSQERVGCPWITQESSVQSLVCRHLGGSALLSHPNWWRWVQMEGYAITPSCSRSSEVSSTILTKIRSLFLWPLVQIFSLNQCPLFLGRVVSRSFPYRILCHARIHNLPWIYGFHRLFRKHLQQVDDP
jgi:hypothetical protein